MVKVKRRFGDASSRAAGWFCMMLARGAANIADLDIRHNAKTGHRHSPCPPPDHDLSMTARALAISPKGTSNTIHHTLKIPEQADRLRVEKGQDLAEENPRRAAAGVYPIEGIAKPCPGKAPR
jgi:hypothetical protein